jgi:hypothetical protein
MKRLPIIACVVALTAGGCKTLDSSWTSKLPWSSSKKIEESKYQTPVRLAAIWTPDVMSEPGKPGMRGFGGRFYFYNEQNKTIPVEGQLVVYAYDDTNRTHAEGRGPDRKFAFTPEQFTKLYSESALGASYSVWVPWDQMGGEQRSISLLPVFTASAGQVVMGQQAMNVLPGRTPAAPQPQQQAAMQHGHVVPAMAIQQMGPANATQASMMQPLGPGDAAQTSMLQPEQTAQNLRTTTIEVPRSMQPRFGFPTAAPAGQTTPQGSDPRLLQQNTGTMQQITGMLPNAGAAAAGTNALTRNQAANAYSTMTQQGQAQAATPSQSQHPTTMGRPPARYEHPRSQARATQAGQGGPAGSDSQQFPVVRQSGHPFSRLPQQSSPDQGYAVPVGTAGY